MLAAQEPCERLRRELARLFTGKVGLAERLRDGDHHVDVVVVDRTRERTHAGERRCSGEDLDGELSSVGIEPRERIDRAGYRVVPEKGSDLAETAEKSSNSSNLAHWANFLDCVRTRQRPASDIEICHRSSTTAHLGNVALRSGLKVDWDAREETVVQKPARRFLTREYRSPWRVD